MVTVDIAVGDSTILLDIGRQGEYDTRQTVFDISYLIDNFGEGTATLVHQRSQDEAPYLVNTIQTDTTLIWTANAIDTAYTGIGEAEIRWYVDNGLAKSIIYKTRVLPSIVTSSEVPDAYESWYDQMIAYLNARTVTSATATTLAEGSEATASYSNGVLTFGIPVGDTGPTGPQGIQGIQGETGNGIVSIVKTSTSGNVDTYTITFTNSNTTTFTVTNGAVSSVNGSTGAVTIGLSATESDGVVTLNV